MQTVRLRPQILIRIHISFQQKRGLSPIKNTDATENPQASVFSYLILQTITKASSVGLV